MMDPKNDLPLEKINHGEGTQRRHTWWKIILTVISLICLVLTAILPTVGGKLGILDSTIQNTSNANSVAIIPHPGTFAIWALIWPWQALWIIYVLVNSIRKTSDGYVYQLCIFPVFVYILNLLSYIVCFIWTIVISKGIITIPALLLFLMALVLFASVALACKCLKDHASKIRQLGFGMDIWASKVLIVNGITIYATWVTIATLLSLASNMVYTWNYSELVADMVALGILTMLFVIFFLLDITILYAYTSCIFTLYLTVIWAISGVLRKSWDLGRLPEVSVFSVSILVSSVMALLVKIAIIFHKCCIKCSK